MTEKSNRPPPRRRSLRRVLSQPSLRRVLPAVLVSNLGDGMSLVSVAWLAVQISPPAHVGVWTGLAVAAYALPATLGAVLLGRLVRGLGGSRLIRADASLRAVALGTIAGLAVTGHLRPPVYVALLALSALLHAWGNAGAYTLIAESLPDEDRLTGNMLLSTANQLSFVVGPALAGGLAVVLDLGWIIGLDALSFAVLAVVAGSAPSTVDRPSDGPPDGTDRGGWKVILGYRRLSALLLVTCVFFFLYGPVEVALPVHIERDLHGSAALLGQFWTVFGVGAVLGGLAAGRLGRRPLWMVVVVIVIGWGAALLPVGLADRAGPGLIGFGLGGVIYGPFMAITTALFQRTAAPAVLSRVLATRSALTGPSAALGTLVGGPLVAVLGGRRTLLWSGLSTIAGGVLLGLVLLALRAARGRTRTGTAAR